MPKLHLQETYINKSENCIVGETGIYETYTDDRGELFRSLQSEYGRCTGKMYIDDSNGAALPIGWVFEALDKYQDADEKYLREVWCTVHTKPPTITTEYHYN